MSNRNSKTSRACRYLIGKYRWILTGTPLTNNTNGKAFSHRHLKPSVEGGNRGDT
ncbi:hypothetical protein QBC38DRAFT_492083 [Podospora fimiseda]|uniref:SNF2 N-terminal domain-containing protein n=1 Tax=Podospora fimiseda TaxID=252190 RepID=A0AAN7BF07_9PEZI|nr:hypothetical protein QBC38DRAFT_492083 [Podospora fimiseda]